MPSPLDTREDDAAHTFLHEVVFARGVPLSAAILFGSKARGEDDELSDIDLLLLCEIDDGAAIDLGDALMPDAEAIGAAAGVEIEPWVVAVEELERGRRTPMLVDALEDGIPIWPAGSPPIRIPFTREDGVYCAECLLDWVATGGEVAARALAEGRRFKAAGRIRDDITRLATAALLLNGDTRHRRISSLDRFREAFFERGLLPPGAGLALDWARAAFPADGGRGRESPPATPAAVASAAFGFECAKKMEEAAVPWILNAIGRTRRAIPCGIPRSARFPRTAGAVYRNPPRTCQLFSP